MYTLNIDLYATNGYNKGNIKFNLVEQLNYMGVYIMWINITSNNKFIFLSSFDLKNTSTKVYI